MTPASSRYTQCGNLISRYKHGDLELSPGCNAEQSLEAAVTGVLNGIRETAAKVRGRASRRSPGLIVCALGQGRAECLGASDEQQDVLAVAESRTRLPRTLVRPHSACHCPLTPNPF